ncbi:hypothetical protein ACTA71_006748 [Dictyostelium dimigraforme]
MYNQLKIDDFEEITYKYIQINKILKKLNGRCKHILLANEIKGENYLSSSVIGAARYFDEIPHLQWYSIDFDNNPSTQFIIEFTISNNHNEEHSKLMTKLDSNLEFQIKEKHKLDSNEIEVEIKSTGINSTNSNKFY